MLINQITKEQKENLEKKFKIFDNLISFKKPAFGYLKADPTLFAYYFLKNDKGENFRALPWQDLYLNSKAKRRLLACARQVGKSTVTGVLALHKAYFNPGFTILVVSRTKDQAMELVYRMRKFLNTSRFTTWKTTISKKQENKREITLQSETKGIESRIIVVPATDAALGYSANIVIGDEAARWEEGDRVFTEVIEPTVTWTQGDIYLLSTPAGRMGFFWDCYNMRDEWEVYQFDWHVNPFLTDHDMEIKRKMHTALSYSMNYDAKFVMSHSSYFTPEEINKSLSSEAGQGWKFESPVVVGVDFGKVNDNSVIYIGCIEDPRKPPNEQTIKVLDRRVKPLGTDYSTILAELKAISDQMKPSVMVLDVTSGETPSDLLSSQGVSVEPFKFTIQSKINIMNNLKVLMQQGRIKLPNSKDLINQLECFEYTLSDINQDRMKLHAADGQHDDEVDALALMAHGLSKGFGWMDSAFVSVGTGAVGKAHMDEQVNKGIQANQDFMKMIAKNKANHTFI